MSLGDSIERWRGLSNTSEAVVQALRLLAADLRSDAATQDSLDRLSRGARVVVAGQQPGLCGGPLLTTLKTIAAVQSADRLTRQGLDTVPIFWNATTDHDLDEMNRVFLPSIDGLTVDRHRVEGWSRGVAASQCFFSDEQVAALIKWMESHDIDLVDDERPVAGEALGRWQSRLMTNRFSGSGLVVLEADGVLSHDLALKARVLNQTAALGVALRETQHARVDRKPLLNVPAGAFLFQQGPPRKRVPAPDEGQDTRAWMAAQGQSVSGDVVGRVLSQQDLLPVAFQVAGPSERLYIEEMARLFKIVDVPPLSTTPRPSCCLLTRARADGFVELGVVGEDRAFPSRWPKQAQRRSRRRRRAEGEEVDTAPAAASRRLRKRLSEWVAPRGRPQERVFSLVGFNKQPGAVVRQLLARELSVTECEVVLLQ